MVSGDEIISDTWELKEKEDVVYEIDCKKINKGGAENFSGLPSLGNSDLIAIVLRCYIYERVLIPVMPSRYWREPLGRGGRRRC